MPLGGEIASSIIQFASAGPNLVRIWFRKKCFPAGSWSGCVIVCLQVVLKIIKHYQEEGQGSEVVQGVLLGLVVEDRLEITNCFPFPQHTEEDVEFDEGEVHGNLQSSILWTVNHWWLHSALWEAVREGLFGFQGERTVKRGIAFRLYFFYPEITIRFD